MERLRPTRTSLVQTCLGFKRNSLSLRNVTQHSATVRVVPALSQTAFYYCQYITSLTFTYTIPLCPSVTTHEGKGKLETA
jgi:hypothetical protein